MRFVPGSEQENKWSDENLQGCTFTVIHYDRRERPAHAVFEGDE